MSMRNATSAPPDDPLPVAKPPPGSADVSSAPSGEGGLGNSKSAPAGAKEWHYRGYLPHFDRPGTLQSISLRLHDSVPAAKIERWKLMLGWTEKTATDAPEAVELRRRIERYADGGHGDCYLRRPDVAGMVQDALRYFDGERYELIAWCLMPNHVHALIRTVPSRPLTDVVHSWKSFTAHRANQLLHREGAFWLPDYYDRRIRDKAHFRKAIDYIHDNPVKAGLVVAAEQWLWSSACPGSADVSSAPSGEDSLGNSKSAPAREMHPPGSADVSSAPSGEDSLGNSKSAPAHEMHPPWERGRWESDLDT